MSLYMVNVLPRQNFHEIYHISELCNITVKIEYFKNSNNPKQCYRCQKFGHASELCNFTTKCVKCAGTHFSPNYPQKGWITPTCANCSRRHPAPYRGCPEKTKNESYINTKHPQNQNNAKIPWPILPKFSANTITLSKKLIRITTLTLT